MKDQNFLIVSIDIEHAELKKCEAAIINTDLNLAMEILTPSQRESKNLPVGMAKLSSLWSKQKSKDDWEKDILPLLKSPDPNNKILGVQSVWNTYLASLGLLD